MTDREQLDLLTDLLDDVTQTLFLDYDPDDADDQSVYDRVLRETITSRVKFLTHKLWPSR